MSEFNIGDQVWFFWTECGRYVFKDHATGVFPKSLNIQNGVIVGASEKCDYVHVYLEGVQDTCCFGYCFCDDSFFKTKEEAIDAMRKQLDALV